MWQRFKKKHINWGVASKYNPNFRTSKFLSRRKHDKSVIFHYANSRRHNNMNLIVDISEVKSRRGSKEIFQLSKMFQG